MTYPLDDHTRGQIQHVAHQVIHAFDWRDHK